MSIPNDATADRWNRRYRVDAPDGPSAPVAAEVLSENQHLLPAGGRALDLACGLGGNAMLLAAKGLATHAWDLSDVAIAQLQLSARALDLNMVAEVRDVCRQPPAAASFDVIVVSRFLDRALMPFLAAALRPGGLIFYQTFTVVRATDGGPSNADFLLGENELRRLFEGLTLRVYREEGRLGDLTVGHRNTAQLVAQQPSIVSPQVPRPAET